MNGKRDSKFMNYEKSLQDVTVLILSHNRQNCLLPAIEYWDKLGVRTLVLDESPSALKNVKRLTHVDYFHVEKGFAERCRMASELLDSKYAIVVSDDELYTPSGLVKMKDELDSDPELVSVGGVALAIWRYGPIVAGSWPYKGTFGYENKANTPLERIRIHTGNGVKPHSAFFTSNLNRVEHLKRCLILYSESPVIATEAISVLTICAAGKSKYLKELYWIRNWNEFPKSHKKWDRSLYLHDWWRSQAGSPGWLKFRAELQKRFSEFSEISQFEAIWSLILSANEVAQPKISSEKYKSKDWLDTYEARYLKYFVKRVTRSPSMPIKFQELLKEMSLNHVKFDSKEINTAVNVVRQMRPYQNWK